MGVWYTIQKRRIKENYDPYYDLSTVCSLSDSQKIRQIFSDMIRWNCSRPRLLSITDIKALTKSVSNEIQKYDFTHSENITFDDYQLIVSLNRLSSILLDYLDDAKAGIIYEYSIDRNIAD